MITEIGSGIKIHTAWNSRDHIQPFQPCFIFCKLVKEGSCVVRMARAMSYALYDSLANSVLSKNKYVFIPSRFFTTIFTTTRLFFSKHLWALFNTLPSIIPYMGSVWCYRNWIELEGINIAPNYPVNLRWRVILWLVRGFRVVDVARILHVW